MQLMFAPWNPKSTYGEKSGKPVSTTSVPRNAAPQASITTNIPDRDIKSKSTRTGGRYEFFGMSKPNNNTPHTIPNTTNTIPNTTNTNAAENNVIKSIGDGGGEGETMDMEKGVVIGENKMITFRTKSAASSSSQEHFKAKPSKNENEIVITLSYSAFIWGSLVATILVNVLITIILFFILKRLSI